MCQLQELQLLVRTAHLLLLAPATEAAVDAADTPGAGYWTRTTAAAGAAAAATCYKRQWITAASAAG
jgi:hypothetical protein